MGSLSCLLGGLQLIGHKDSVWSLQHHAHLPVSQAVLPENCGPEYRRILVVRFLPEFVGEKHSLRLGYSSSFVWFERIWAVYLSNLCDIYIRYTVHIT